MLPKIPEGKRKKLGIINLLFIIAICFVLYFYRDQDKISFVIALCLLVSQIIFNRMYYRKNNFRAASE